MFLFFDLFHSVHDLLDSFQDIIEAAENNLPKSVQQQLADSITELREDFRALCLPDSTTIEAGDNQICRYLEQLLEKSATFGNRAEKLRRFDLMRNCASLVREIKGSLIYKTAHQRLDPPLPPSLAFILPRAAVSPAREAALC